MNKISYKHIDNNHLDALFAAGKYAEAADYYDSFDYTGASDLVRDKVLSKINELHRAAAKNQALYSTIGEENTSKLKFNDAWANPNAYNELRYQKDTTGNFIYEDDESFAKDYPEMYAFHNAYAKLGSSITLERDSLGYRDPINSNSNDAVTLKATLPNKKYASSGIFFGADWLIKDNSNDVDTVFNYLHSKGITKEQLIASGVNINYKDNGDTEFIYDKYSDYGPILTIALANASSKYNSPTNRVRFQGYDKNGDKIKYQAQTNYITDHYYPNNINNDGTLPISRELDKKNINDMLSLVYNSESFAEKLKSGGIKDTETVISGTQFALPSIKKEEDKKRIIDFTESMVFGTYDHYVTFDADDAKPLHKIEEGDEFGEFVRAMSVRNTNQIHIMGMTINGETGILITLDPNKTNDKGEAKGKRMQMFIPGYLNSLTSDAINNSTDLQALQVFNDMKQYGNNYRYRFKDGSSAVLDNGVVRKFGRDGNMIFDEEVTTEDLVRDLDRDFILRQANMQINKYIRQDGSYNMNSVEQVAQIIAYNAAEELYPNLTLQDTDGSQITPEDIFGKNKEKLNSAYSNSNAYVRKKLDEIFNIYNTILGYTFNN